MKTATQGVVMLESIIERDGTVSAVRVRHSVDPVHGLDQEAIRTVRQWQFRPGQKDGVPVRTRMFVTIMFDLGHSIADPKVEWPNDFRPPVDAHDLFEGFSEKAVTIANLQVRFKYPPDWVIVPDAGGDQLISVQKIDAREVRTCSLSKPTAVSDDLRVPVSRTALDAFGKSIKQEIQRGPDGIELVEVGQAQVREHLWIWSEMARRTIDLSAVPSDRAAQLNSTFDGMAMWRFTTTDSGQELSLICYALKLRGVSKDELKRARQRAGDDFRAIVNGLFIRSR